MTWTSKISAVRFRSNLVRRANPHRIYAEACALYKCFPVACVVDDIIERQWLDVNNRGLSENDAYCIQQVIDVSAEVKGVNVSGNYMQTRGIQGIVKSLEIHKIVHLNISNTGFIIDSDSFSKNIFAYNYANAWLIRFGFIAQLCW